MRNFILSCLVFFCLMLTGCQSSPQPKIYQLKTNRESIYYGNSSPILKIRASIQHQGSIVSCYGTGFLTKYKNQKIIITALHVVYQAKIFQFYTEDKKYVDVLIDRIVAIPKLDTAVFFIRYTSAKIKPFEVDDLYLGDNIQTIGFPAGGEKKIYEGKPTVLAFESSAKVESGMSGGPIVKNGKVVGIISQIIRNGGNSQSLGIKVIDVFNTLEKYKK